MANHTTHHIQICAQRSKRFKTVVRTDNGSRYSTYGVLTFWHPSFIFNSNKSPTWCNNFSVYYTDVCLQFNMFRAFSRPSPGAQWLQWQPLVYLRIVVKVVLCSWPAGTARLSPRYEGKTRGCHCSHWVPGDGRGNARNMLNCKQTSG
jgi:hypothetical protein